LRYVIVDPGPASENGFPAAVVTVKRSEHPATLPEPNATLKLVDYGFRGPRTVRYGRILRIVNAGSELHDAIPLKVPNGMTAQTIKRQLAQGLDEQVVSEVDTIGSLIDLVSPGAVNQGPVRLARGTWVLACFAADHDGEPRRTGAPRRVSDPFPRQPSGGRPEAVGLRGRGRPGAWLVEDRWWTAAVLRRRYWEVLTADRRKLVIFRDLVSGRWSVQRSPGSGRRRARARPGVPVARRRVV
jgi:hypothetical protein